MSDRTCLQSGCGKRLHSHGRCWKHVEEWRRAAGDLCGHDGCERGRFYRGLCGKHGTRASQREHGRHYPVYVCRCVRCGVEFSATKQSARFCSKACSHGISRQLVHVGPSHVTHLPDRHPAVREMKPEAPWWKMFVSGPCAWCDESFTAVASSFDTRTMYCSRRCQRQANNRASGKFYVPPQVRQSIYERDGWVCQLCMDPVDPDLDPVDAWAATLDHIVCQSWGDEPDHSPENLRLAHRWCNSVRGNEYYYSEDDLKVA